MFDSYNTTIPAAGHWSVMVRQGMQMTLTDIEGGANAGMLMYNPLFLTEKYNAPDTLKCQHTFKLTKGNCLYSDMGRIFCSIIADDFGWHETVCGNSHPAQVKQQWGERNYQRHNNQWHQNGYDSFLVELAKYGLSKKALAANINWFSEVKADDDGNVFLTRSGKLGDKVTLRFEMDTLVLLHTCPHPLNTATNYPSKPIGITLERAKPVYNDDYCMNFRPENKRGFENNALYHFGL